MIIALKNCIVVVWKGLLGFEDGGIEMMLESLMTWNMHFDES